MTPFSDKLRRLRLARRWSQKKTRRAVPKVSATNNPLGDQYSVTRCH